MRGSRSEPKFSYAHNDSETPGYTHDERSEWPHERNVG